MKHHRILPALLLLFLGLPAAAQPPAFLGPLRVRDLSPISMLRLDFVPAFARQPELWSAVRLNYSHANVYIVSDAVGQYLDERGSDGPLEADDIEALLSRPGDVFFFDGELSVVEVEYVHAMTDRLQIQLAWPLHVHGGGFLDSTIEGFHDLIGHDSARRELTSRNDMQVVARLRGDELVMIEHGTKAGTSDPTLTLRHATPLGVSTDLIMEAAVKVPVGDEEEYFSSGDYDVGVQLSLQHRMTRDALYVSASFIDVGDIRIFPNFPMTDTWTIAMAWEHAFRPGNWGLVQGTWSRGSFRNAGATGMTEDRTQLSLGLRRQIGTRLVATAAITENVIEFKNTPDIGVHFGIGWLVKR